MRKIAVVTTGRADFNILLPVIQALASREGVECQVIASGDHFQSQNLIEANGLVADALVDTVREGETALAQSAALGKAVTNFGQAYDQLGPDILVLLGDRFETIAAGLAASAFNLPIAHISGGEVTLGAIDENYRHALTKLSHIHFASCEAYADRIRRMGEEPWRVHNSGSPSIDIALSAPRLSHTQFLDRYGIDLSGPFIVATYHPETLRPEGTPEALRGLTKVVEQSGIPTLWTMPNADVGSEVIRAVIQERSAKNDHWQVHEALGIGYYTALASAAVMVGNSSSGITEAPSFGLPVVNIGDRQTGRFRAENIIDCETSESAIKVAMDKALSPAFRESIKGVRSPFGDGTASRQILEVLATVELGHGLVRKQFHDG